MSKSVVIFSPVKKESGCNITATRSNNAQIIPPTHSSIRFWFSGFKACPIAVFISHGGSIIALLPYQILL